MDSEFIPPSDLPLDPSMTYSPRGEMARRLMEEIERQPENRGGSPLFNPGLLTVWSVSGVAGPGWAGRSATDADEAKDAPQGAPVAPPEGPKPKAASAHVASSTPPSYELLKLVGRGGCGEVWEARQNALGRSVAVKRVRPDLLNGGEVTEEQRQVILALFRQEAVTTGLLEHPNIVPIHDLGTSGEGLPLLAMRLVRGMAWDKLIRQDWTALQPADFLAKHLPILLDTANAVAFAHSRGIIHRDLKPGQVMTGEFGETVLMDWGLAVFVGAGHMRPLGTGDDPADRPPATPQSLTNQRIATLESASNPAGTPVMMAPEQTLNTAAHLGFWTDIYLLGGTLYFLLTGSYPHSAPTPADTMRRAAKGEVTPPDQRAPRRAIPPVLADLCLKALAPAPSDRHATVSEFIVDLKDYLTGAGARRESHHLIETVRAEIEAIQPGSNYQSFVAMLSQLDRARMLWPDNQVIAPVRDRVLEAYARDALNQGDLNLASIQASGIGTPDRGAPLRLEIKAARTREKYQHRSRRWLVSAVIALLVFGIIGSLLAIRRQRHLMHEMGERMKEISCIYRVGEAIRHGQTVEGILQQSVNLLPTAMAWPDLAFSTAELDGHTISSEPDATAVWEIAATIFVRDVARGRISVAYQDRPPGAPDDPFVAEERNLVDAIARMLGEGIDRREAEATERAVLLRMGQRIKELSFVYSASSVIREAVSTPEMLERLVQMIPAAWQHSDVTTVRITVDGRSYENVGFAPSPWRQAAILAVAGRARGEIEIYYTEERPEEDEGPFLAEERNLLSALARMISEGIERRDSLRDQGATAVVPVGP